MNYKEFQFGIMMFLVSIPVQIFLTVMFITQTGTNPMPFMPFVMANSAFIITYLLFYGMKTTIDHEFIRISYGIGVIQKKIKLQDVKTVTTVSNPWYYGWGIRFISNGTLYNIKGSAGVELTFRETSGIVRIGSANALSLKEAILLQIEKKRV